MGLKTKYLTTIIAFLLRILLFLEIFNLFNNEICKLYGIV